MTGMGKIKIGPNGEKIYYRDEDEFFYKCPQCGQGTVRTCRATEEQLHCFECGAKLRKLYKGRNCNAGCVDCPMPEDIDGLKEL